MRVYATDGACAPNPGNGGWGWTDGVESGAGRVVDTTNNRMELQAVIELLKSKEGDFIVVSDSLYVIHTCTNRIPRIVFNGVMLPQRKPVPNSDLILELAGLLEKREIVFKWVRGHTGHPLNEMADRLASGLEKPGERALRNIPLHKLFDSDPGVSCVQCTKVSKCRFHRGDLKLF